MNYLTNKHLTICKQKSEDTMGDKNPFAILTKQIKTPPSINLTMQIDLYEKHI